MYIEREVNGKIIYGWGIPIFNTGRAAWTLGPFVKDTDKLYYGCFDK